MIFPLDFGSVQKNISFNCYQTWITDIISKVLMRPHSILKTLLCFLDLHNLFLFDGQFTPPYHVLRFQHQLE